MEATFKTSAITIGIIILGIAIFLAGGIVGIIYQKQNSGTITGQQTNNTATAKSELRSKVVSSISLYGKVKSISGRTIIIVNNGDSLPVLISQDATINMLSLSDGKTVQEKSSFEKIKVGDNLNISVKVLENNSFSGVIVTIFPNVNKK